MLLYRKFNQKYRTKVKEYLAEKNGEWDWDDPLLVRYNATFTDYQG
jgi:hypothetical protein